VCVVGWFRAAPSLSSLAKDLSSCQGFFFFSSSSLLFMALVFGSQFNFAHVTWVLPGDSDTEHVHIQSLNTAVVLSSL